MAKQVTATECKRHELEVVPRDNKRAKKGPTRDKAETYLLVAKSFLLKVKYDQIADNAWDLLDPLDDDGKPKRGGWVSNRQGFIRDAGSQWLTAVCPQAGGALDAVEISDYEGVSLTKRNQLAMVHHDGVGYYIPQQQLELVRKLYDEDDMIYYLGPTFEGIDLFGDKFCKPCPLIIRVRGVGIVALIMLMRKATSNGYA